MKTYYKLPGILGILLLFSVVSQANWQKRENKNSFVTQERISQQNKRDPISDRGDSLPNNFTDEAIKGLRDEKGNKIFSASQSDHEEGSRPQGFYTAGKPVNVTTTTLTITGEASNNEFGFSVSTAGDVNGDGFSDVIVGAWKHNNITGRAYVFYGGSPMDNIADVTLTGASGGIRFGYSVSSAGDVNGDGYSDVIVGAHAYSSFTGRAYVYYGGSSMNQDADVTMTGDTTFNDFGRSVSTAGDVNGDGFSDVIVGAWNYDVYRGRAYVYYGSSSMNNVADVIMTGESASVGFGFSVSTAGDVNGDGYSDVIAGARNYNNYTGRSYIFYGGSSMNNVADVTMTGEVTFDDFGFSVSTAGDVNGDGFADVIVSAWLHGPPNSTGRVYIFYGGSSMNNAADVIMNGEAIANHFGVSVSTAGDVNRDGYSDVIVGADGYGSSTGRAYVFYGGSSMNNVADIIMTGEATSNNFGKSVSTAGDVNNDGYSDIIVGAYDYGSGSGVGRAYVYISETITLNLTLFIEGFYNSATNLQVSDTIKVYLRNAIPPFNKVDSVKAVISSNGSATLHFGNATTGTYYIVVTHRNSIETWSESGGEVLTLGASVNYDMSNIITQAFGSNLMQVDATPVRFAIYSGDVNQDGSVDLSDLGLIDNDVYNFNSGYVAADVNGDGFVDISDLEITDNNAINFIVIQRP
ncbi:MAG: FG-GAP-like repeat-containing protein [Bacteroidota bacterium]|nr:FG-GAP-like repeat-containing protein [Bacteroidota bacterium]